MSEKKVVKLIQSPKGFGEVADELEESMFESPLPTQCTHSYYEDETLGLYIGVWDTTDMIESAAPYSCDEFMTIIEGAVEIKNNKIGKVETVTAGQSFVIPQGYDCQWHQNGYLKKFYVIYEPPAQDLPASPVCEHIIYIDEKSQHLGKKPQMVLKRNYNIKVMTKNSPQVFGKGAASKLA